MLKSAEPELAELLSTNLQGFKDGLHALLAKHGITPASAGIAEQPPAHDQDPNQVCCERARSRAARRGPVTVGALRLLRSECR